MGVQDLHSHFINRSSYEKRDNKPQHSLSELDGPVGIDVSTIMYRHLRTALGSAVIDVEPAVPLYHAFHEITNTIMLLTGKHKLDIVLCFDNKPHPMKADTQTSRRLDRLQNLDELQRLYHLGESNDAILEAITKHRKQLASPREDLVAMLIKFCKEKSIKYCSAPFEADWQLVSLQQQGIIKHIMTVDGDLFVLGGDSIVTEVNFTSGACCIYTRDTIMDRPSMGGGMFLKEHLPLLSCLSGNDYIKRLNGNGPKTVLRLMSEFTQLDTQDDKESFIFELEAKSKWDKLSSKPADGFEEKFWKAYHLHFYAPVFQLSSKREDATIDLLDLESYDVSLQPLNPLPNDRSACDWGSLIGFNAHPLSLFTSDPKLIFRMECWGEMEQQPQELPLPTLRVAPHHDVPHGSYLDESIPTNKQSSWSLQTFLATRKLAPRGKFKTKLFAKIADKVLDLMRRDPERAPQPAKYDPQARCGSYSDEETLMPREGSQVEWSSNWNDVETGLDAVSTLDDDDFEKVFGSGCNGIQTRAKRLIRSGHFDLSKIQVAEVALKSNGNDAIAIRMQSVPSMKSEPYWVMAVFDCVTKRFVVPPCSRCDCPAGLNGCSHLRALYAILSFIQDCIGLHSHDEIVAMFPPVLSTMKGLPIPWDYAFQESTAEKELKRLNRIAVKSRRITCDSDSDYDGYDSDSTSCESSDDDAFDYDANESDSEDEEAEILERFEPATEASTVIKLCEFVREMVADSAAYADLSGSGATNEYKLEQTKIRKCLQDHLDGVGGPDGSITEKLQQLHTHEALHSEFESGNIPKCLLSILSHADEETA